LVERTALDCALAAIFGLPGTRGVLGLSVVHGFVKQSGGSVAISSEVGRGTHVQIFLPAAAGVPQISQPESVLSRVPGVRLTVLCVEDDPVVLMTTAEMLRELGYRVIEAMDGPTVLPASEVQVQSMCCSRM
jgi:hypothetical protein